MKFLKRLEPLSLLALRLVLGLIFLANGYPKLVHPNDPTMRGFFISHGMPGYFLGLAGILESFGAVLFFIGLFTRPAALVLIGEMGVAIWKVHSAHGILAVKDYEFPLAMAAGCLILATIGAGALSVDSIIFGSDGKKRRVARASKE